MQHKRFEDLALKYTPNFLLDAYGTCQGFIRKRQRLSSLYGQYEEFFRKTAKWSESELLSYQNSRLHEIVPYCYRHVPFYRELFDQHSLDPQTIRTVEDLPKLPILDRQTVVDAETQLVSRQFDPAKLVKYHTSGSTGSPMTLYFSPETWPAQYAFFWLRWRPGVTCDDKYACFQGQKLIAPDRKRPPFWRTNYANRQRLYSVFHLSEENLSYYIDNLNLWQPEYIQGYPSAMHIVADYMQRNGLKFRHPLKGAFCMSETVQEKHREVISQAWSCPVWDQYGQGERVASITLYECGNYHYDMDFGIIDFVTLENTGNGEVAEIVGTSLINKAWTLLRYRTGDLVLMDRDSRCPCGRPGPVIKSIIGRTGDVITTPDGRKIINVTAAVKDVRHLKQLQVVQTSQDSVVGRVVRAIGYNNQDETEIMQCLKNLFGPRMNISIRHVEQIERTAGGKFKAIVSQI